MQTWQLIKHLFIPLLLLFNTANLHAAGERIALVIGNGQYQHLNPLKNPANDAQAVAQRLKALNFQLIDAKGENTNKPVLDLQENTFAKTVSRFAERAKGAEIAFLYYAGHGMQASGESYLLPIDAPKDDVELIIRNAISLDRTLDKLDGKAQLTVAVFDACREIPNLEQTTRSAGLSPNAYRGLARAKNSGSGRIVAFAGAAGELVADGDGSNSPYTTELINVLKNPQGDVDDVMQQVASNFTQKHAGQQPELLIQPTRQNYYYFKPPQPQLNAEAIFWQSVEQQPSEAGYRDYLNQYPQGIFASLAQRRLLAYQTPTPPTPKPIVTEPRQPYEPEMVAIPAGSFLMGDIHGSGTDDEQPVHTVQLKSFLIGKHEITQAQWRAVMGSNPSLIKGDHLPAESVNWNDVQEYIQKLNAKTGKQYRLPSEAEWEYAARAGTSTVFSAGNCIHTEQANYDGNYYYKDCNAKTGVYSEKTVPVGSFPANAFGLHDMHGNVWEWVQDCWHKNYQGAPTNGKAWEKENASDCSRRVVRGSGWFYSSWFHRSADRFRILPTLTSNTLGFRLASDL